MSGKWRSASHGKVSARLTSIRPALGPMIVDDPLVSQPTELQLPVAVGVELASTRGSTVIYLRCMSVILSSKLGRTIANVSYAAITQKVTHQPTPGNAVLVVS